MSRRVIAVVLLLAGGSLAHAQDATPTAEPTPAPAQDPQPPEEPAPAPEAVPAPALDAAPAPTTDAAPADTSEQVAPPDLSDQAIGAAIGAAVGGRTTAGGLRVAGNYLYQLTTQDWFDGAAAFTFGSGGAECFRDRDDDVLCDHGLADGYAVDVSANVRRFLGGRDNFWPFARAGIAAALVRFSDDDVTGVAVQLHAGAGLRVSVHEGIALVGLADLMFGVARFNGGVGAEPQLGVNVTAGVEFRL